MKKKRLVNSVAPVQKTTNIEGDRTKPGKALESPAKLPEENHDKEQNLNDRETQLLPVEINDDTEPQTAKKLDVIETVPGRTNMAEVDETNLAIDKGPSFAELPRNVISDASGTGIKQSKVSLDSKAAQKISFDVIEQIEEELPNRQNDNEKPTRRGTTSEEARIKTSIGRKPIVDMIRSSFAIPKASVYNEKWSYGDLVGTSRWYKKRLNETDYDPHEHRHPENATTNWETLFNILKCCTSTGILTMPRAFAFAGLFNGLLFCVIMITLITYSINTLIKCQYLLCKRLKIPLITYPDTMMAALTVGPKFCRRIARYSSTFMECLITLNQTATCATYLIFVVNNVKLVCDQYIRLEVSEPIYCLGLLVPFLVISSVRNMKTFASLSLLGNCATVVSFVLIMVSIVDDLPDIYERKAVGKAYDFPLFVSNMLFSFDSLSSIIAAENNMEDPKSFGGFFGVFNMSMILLAIVLGTIGFFGYWKYGEGVHYLLSLDLPIHSKLSQIVLIIYSAGVIVTFGMQQLVPSRIFTRHVRHSDHRLTWEYFIRLTFIFASLLMAMTLRFTRVMVPVFGSLCGTTLKFACPALIELCLKYSDHLGHRHWMVLTEVIIIIGAIIAMTTGLYFSISHIVNAKGQYTYNS